MIRLRSYSLPHKALRNILSKFAMLAGQTDYADLQQVNKLKELGKEAFFLLNDHVHTENDHTLTKLEQRAPGSSAHDIHDHEELEKIQDALEARMNALNGTQNAEEGHQFYLEVTHFQSLYLGHIYHEETVTEKALQDNFSDEELMGHRGEIMGGMPFPTLLTWLKYAIPAQAVGENIGLLTGFKAMAPAEAFNAVMATVKTVMSREQYEAIEEGLNIGAVA